MLPKKKKGVSPRVGTFRNVRFIPWLFLFAFSLFSLSTAGCTRTTTQQYNKCNQRRVARARGDARFIVFYFANSRNSRATRRMPPTQLSYVALILKFRHGRSFARCNPQRGCGIMLILSICRSYINFRLRSRKTGRGRRPRAKDKEKERER